MLVVVVVDQRAMTHSTMAYDWMLLPLPVARTRAAKVGDSKKATTLCCWSGLI